ncbi:MAG: hypothetical protein EBV77_03870 [Gemmatimonadaceae bacterium]|jgi:hypothetical protein|nr:hypothetical protein [Gemmatimonadaceae bacterium]
MLAAAACGKTKNVTPADVALQFYVTLELGGVREVPEPRALVAIEPYLTPELAGELRAARVRRDAPLPPGSTDKPPFTDGNPFSSLFEGHSTYRLGATAMRGDSALVTVSFTNTEQKPAVEWKDTLLLLPSGTGVSRTWRVADIRYGSTWEFGYRGSLRAVLQSGLGTAR